MALFLAVLIYFPNNVGKIFMQSLKNLFRGEKYQLTDTVGAPERITSLFFHSFVQAVPENILCLSSIDIGSKDVQVKS